MFTQIDIQTEERQSLVLVTDQVQAAIATSGVPAGIGLLYCPHTTAAITVNSYLDPNTAADLHDEIDRLVPTRTNFKHIFDTPADASGHIKASLIGNHLPLIIEDGQAVLGHSQGIFLWEYDGPRTRQLYLKILAG